jgi:uncharacterized protein
VILCDVNVLLYAFRRDAREHEEFHRWLVERLGAAESYGVSELVLSSVIRISTHPRVFVQPSTVEEALAFAAAVRDRPNAVLVAPGPRHWDIFTDLCRTTAARGNLVPDAYFAALAMESGSEWQTTDRDYSRFPGLRWRHPLERNAGSATR